VVSGPAHLGKELVVEPAHEPAHLDPWAGIERQQPPVAELGPDGLVEEFSDDRRPLNRGLPFRHQDRSRAGRVEDQEFPPAAPHARSSISRAVSPNSPSASRTNRECGQNG